MFGNFNITLNITKNFPLNKSLHDLFFTQDVYGKTFLWEDFWLMHQLYRDSTTHTPTSQRFEIFSGKRNLYASRLATFSLLPSRNLHQSEKVLLPDKDNSDDNIPLLQKQCFNDGKLRAHWNIQFFCPPVVTILSNLQSGRSHWENDNNIFSKERDFFWPGVKRWVSFSNSYLVYKPAGIGWHTE